MPPTITHHQYPENYPWAARLRHHLVLGATWWMLPAWVACAGEPPVTVFGTIVEWGSDPAVGGFMAGLLSFWWAWRSRHQWLTCVSAPHGIRETADQHSIFPKPAVVANMAATDLVQGDALVPVIAAPELAGESMRMLFQAAQPLLEYYCESVGVAVAMMDTHGRVLVEARWRQACKEFRRMNPEACGHCLETDPRLAIHLRDGQSYSLFRCHNGLTDCVAPVMVHGRHVANVVVGPFLLQPADKAYFRHQAETAGFDPVQYLEAICEVPVIDERRLPAILGFLTRWAHGVATDPRCLQRQAEPAIRL